MTPYPHLFSPLRIGNVTVRNRIMQTAHVKLFARTPSTRSATSTTRPRARRAAPAS